MILWTSKQEKYLRKKLSDFIAKESKTFFNANNITLDFININPTYWEEDNLNFIRRNTTKN